MAESNTYIFHSDYCELIINSNKYGDVSIMISNSDYELVSKYKWHLDPNKKLLTKFYVATKIGNGRKGTRNLRLHKLLIDTPEGMVVDHINRNTLDNRRENLRIITRAENNRNKEIINTNNKTTGIKGISYYFYKGWNDYSYIVNLKGYKTNRFRTLEEALEYKSECVKGLHKQGE